MNAKQRAMLAPHIIRASSTEDLTRTYSSRRRPTKQDRVEAELVTTELADRAKVELTKAEREQLQREGLVEVAFWAIAPNQTFYSPRIGWAQRTNETCTYQAVLDTLDRERVSMRSTERVWFRAVIRRS